MGDVAAFQVVLTGHDNWPQDHADEEPEALFLKEWSSNMTVALAPLMDPTNLKTGVFAAACYTHTGFNHAGPLIQGLNLYQAFTNYYYNVTTPDMYKLSDDCGVKCNPTCV
jgi:hypothetical protein